MVRLNPIIETVLKNEKFDKLLDKKYRVKRKKSGRGDIRIIDGFIRIRYYHYKYKPFNLKDHIRFMIFNNWRINELIKYNLLKELGLNKDEVKIYNMNYHPEDRGDIISHLEIGPSIFEVKMNYRKERSYKFRTEEYSYMSDEFFLDNYETKEIEPKFKTLKAKVGIFINMDFIEFSIPLIHSIEDQNGNKFIVSLERIGKKDRFSISYKPLENINEFISPFNELLVVNKYNDMDGHDLINKDTSSIEDISNHIGFISIDKEKSYFTSLIKQA